MLRRGVSLVSCLFAAAVSLAAAAEPPAASSPTTHRVGLVPFKIEARVEGVFESPKMAEVRADPASWTELVVKEAVPHGTRVGKGDVLVRLETKKLDEAIENLRIGNRLADLAHALMTRELEALEKSTPRQLVLAGRARRNAAEDRRRYEDKEQALAGGWNDLWLKWSEFQRRNAEEELAQLEKMYAQDDLTEETEEIVLSRARFWAEVMRFFETDARDSHERAVALDLPRALERIRDTAEAAALDQERAEATLPLALDKLRLQVEQSEHERRQAAARLADLEADRRLLPLTAPTDGLVYYGRWERGKWVAGEEAAGKLRPGGQLQPRETVITIVGDGELHLAAAVAEKDLDRVRPRAGAKIAPRAFPEQPLAGTVRSVAAVPFAPGQYRAVIDLAEQLPHLVAGMEAEIRVVSDLRPEVLAVPREAVFSEELDDAKRYVMVVPGPGQDAVKRTVAVGRSNDKLTEITAGLAVGEEILREKPPAAGDQPPAKATPPVKPDADKKPAAAAPPAAASPAASGT